MNRLTSAVVGLLVLASPLSAQFPIGHATPIGSYTPSLGAEPLWLGNTGFGYAIKNAPPGGSAFVAVTAQRVEQMIGGLQIYVDVANILITHAGPVDGSGQAFLPVPLGGPENAALAGIQAYAQAAVDDPASPGIFGTTQGLLLEVTLHPVWAFSGTTQDIRLVDTFTATAPVTAFPTGTTIADVTFANGGRDLFVATDDGLFVVDTLAPTPTPVALGFGTFLNSLAWDRVHRRLYALSTSNGILRVVDGDRASPTFGTLITQLSVLPTSQLHVAVSADGSRLALVQNSGVLERRIADPGNPAYLAVIPTPPPSITFGFGSYLQRPDISPDGRIVSIPVSHPAVPMTEIHRFDGATGQWIDYDPALPDYQPLKSTNHPGVPAGFLTLPFRDGTAMILSGTPVVRVDFDPVNPANAVVTTTPVLPPTVFYNYLSLSPSGRFLVRRDFNTSMISLVEVASGLVTPWVNVPVTNIFGSTPNTWR